MLITTPIGHVDKCSLWKPNILLLFNLGWWLQHSVAAVLLISKQARSKIWLNLASQKCFVGAFQKVYRGKCLICLNVATVKNI